MVERLSDRGRRRVFRVVCYLAYADDELDLRERGVLEDVRARLDLDASEASALEEEARAGKGIQLKADPEEAEVAIEALAEVFVADGVLHPDEARRLNRVAKSLSVSDKRLATVVRRAIRARNQG